MSNNAVKKTEGLMEIQIRRDNHILVIDNPITHGRISILLNSISYTEIMIRENNYYYEIHCSGKKDPIAIAVANFETAVKIDLMIISIINEYMNLIHDIFYSRKGG